ncbi:helix-turn-helix transcriptional regulator [Streptomyces sp. ND04-05B]|uniref:helix-turn-helix transcriptional regulator n=1 Tax=Streptomyces sp. ND04-05B TaxID=3028693 RepID=UPI0029B33E5C|nr:helix-turn-helix transcriptional regulator [Streptomyces sp. ND04-05B]MDX3063391.1 helix-turn-helix transcriptional regulator [Streptomyces sp. ND04-05B]
MKNSKRGETDRAYRFADWLHEQLTAKGYDLSGARSGGKSRFAEDSGISPSTVGRLLDGKRVTDMDVLARLADKLGLTLGTVLLRAGIVTEADLIAVEEPETGPDALTPERAATALNITDPHKRAVFVSMTETLQQPPPDTGEERLAEH